MVNAPQVAGKESQKKFGWCYAHRFLILRRISQIFVLCLFLSGPLLGVWVLKGNYSSSRFLDVIPATDPLVFLQTLMAGHWPGFVTVMLGAVVITLVYAILGGRVYCAWVCPFNMLTDAASWCRRKLGIQSGVTLSNKLRYAIFFAVLLGSFSTGVIIWEWMNPVSITGRGIISSATEVAKVDVLSFEVLWRILVSAFGAAGWLLLGIFIFDVFVVKNGWCGHLCPMGAMYSLIGSKGLLYVDAKERHACTKCMDCIHTCPESQVLLQPLFAKQESTLITSSECTKCGKCIDICAEKVFSIKVVVPIKKKNL